MSAAAVPVPVSERPRPAWLFSRGVDLAVFGGSALLSMVLLGVGARLGILTADTPDWAWVPAVLLVDVAHVYATAFRVYLDPGEVARRPSLYALVPIAAYVAGVLVYAQGGEHLFWRVLAYVAVFHFVRQQRGWVALYHAKAGRTAGLSRAIDVAAVYAATIYPLLWWHGHLPRTFWWFLPGDFVSLPAWLGRAAWPVYAIAMLAWVASAIRDAVRGTSIPGKDLVIATTALCWYVGIVAIDGDYAFTVTNVLVHGIPYLALVWFYVRQRAAEPASGAARAIAARGVWLFLATLWVAAYLEELLWDRAVWHDHAWLFGHPWHAADLAVWIVPALALPQVVHYVLDGFVWRRRRNPVVGRMLYAPDP